LALANLKSGHFFQNRAMSGSGQISSQIWPDLADASATAVRSVLFLFVIGVIYLFLFGLHKSVWPHN